MPAANTGGNETFGSAEELACVAQQGLLIDTAAMPSVRQIDRHGRDIALNRYILDYWAHTQKHALIHGNGLREGARGFPWLFDCKMLNLQFLSS